MRNSARTKVVALNCVRLHVSCAVCQTRETRLFDIATGQQKLSGTIIKRQHCYFTQYYDTKYEKVRETFQFGAKTFFQE